jgi:glycosyltransferase involved in cell wall biosynthesis
MSLLPKITVITPVLNGAKTLEKAIQSLLDQNYPNLEYIVLDAASADGTVDIIRKYEQYITFWRSYPDGGPAPAHNEGLRRATGDIIAFLNADDWYEPGVLQRVGEAIAKDPDLDVVNFQAQMQSGDRIEVVPPERCDFASGQIPTLIPNARFLTRRLYDRLGPFIEDFGGHKIIGFDLEFIWRVCLSNPKSLFIPQVAYTYFVHEGSMTFSNNPVMNLRLARERTLFSLDYLKRYTLNETWRQSMRKNIRKSQLMLLKEALKNKEYAAARHEFMIAYQTLGIAFVWFCLRKGWWG